MVQAIAWWVTKHTFLPQMISKSNSSRYAISSYVLANQTCFIFAFSLTNTSLCLILGTSFQADSEVMKTHMKVLKVDFDRPSNPPILSKKKSAKISAIVEISEDIDLHQTVKYHIFCFISPIVHIKVGKKSKIPIVRTEKWIDMLDLQFEGKLLWL